MMIEQRVEIMLSEHLVERTILSKHECMKVLNAPSVFSVDRQGDHERAVILNKIQEANRFTLHSEGLIIYSSSGSLYQHRFNKLHSQKRKLHYEYLKLFNCLNSQYQLSIYCQFLEIYFSLYINILSLPIKSDHIFFTHFIQCSKNSGIDIPKHHVSVSCLFQNYL